jgi:hypothetical protein
MTYLAPSPSCAGLTRASRLGTHGLTILIGMAGTSPAVTIESQD